MNKRGNYCRSLIKGHKLEKRNALLGLFSPFGRHLSHRLDVVNRHFSHR